MNPPTSAKPPPVFIFGVPRSGTTLMRTLLDSHPAIACGPETPWLGGHQPRSVMEVWKFLREHEVGYCASYGMGKEVATEAARAMVSVLMERYAAARGKKRWAEKTPDNVLHLGFLLELFPEARAIHLTRDGLDVALSTSVVAEHRKGISAFLEQSLGLGPNVPAVENNPLTALLRWAHWDGLVRTGLEGREHLRVSYESLVSEPGPTMRRVMEFIGEPFEAGMLDYSKFGHEFPAWEWGSADVRARGAITKERIGRGRREFSAEQMAVLGPVARGGGEPVLGPGVAGDPGLAVCGAWLDGFARPLGLSATRPEAWLWLNGLGLVKWSGKRLLVLGDGREGIAWGVAMLGAEVVFAGGDGKPCAAMRRLRDGLRVNVTWRTDGVEADAALGSSEDVEGAFGLVKRGGLIASVSDDLHEMNWKPAHTERFESDGRQFVAALGFKP